MKVVLTLNGETMEFQNSITISELLQHLGLPKKGIFIEYNREPLERELYGEIRISNGDNIEIVTMMAGG